MSQRWMWAMPPARSISRFVSSSFSTERATSSTVAPASATFTAVALPIPEEAPVISTTLPRTARAQRAVLEQVGIEVALPVVPDAVRVGLQRRHRDPRALERRLRVRRVEAGRVADVGEHAGRDAELAQRRLHRPLRRREEAQPGARPATVAGSVTPESSRSAACGASAALGEEVDHLARRSSAPGR